MNRFDWRLPDIPDPEAEVLAPAPPKERGARMEFAAPLRETALRILEARQAEFAHTSRVISPTGRITYVRQPPSGVVVDSIDEFVSWWESHSTERLATANGPVIEITVDDFVNAKVPKMRFGACQPPSAPGFYRYIGMVSRYALWSNANDRHVITAAGLVASVQGTKEHDGIYTMEFTTGQSRDRLQEIRRPPSASGEWSFWGRAHTVAEMAGIIEPEEQHVHVLNVPIDVPRQSHFLAHASDYSVKYSFDAWTNLNTLRQDDALVYGVGMRWSDDLQHGNAPFGKGPILSWSPADLFHYYDSDAGSPPSGASIERRAAYALFGPGGPLHTVEL